MNSRGKGAAAPAITIVAAITLAACGGKATPPPPPPKPVVVKKKPPPPPPVCVPASMPAMVSMATSDGSGAQFCVGDGGEAQRCFSVDLESKKYAELDASPIAQTAGLEPGSARLLVSPTEVKVCTGEGDDTCKSLKPKVPKNAERPIDAAVSANGAFAVLMLGDAEAGKGVAEIWDVAKAKKSATIKYAKGDNKCGTAQMLGDVIYISASVCAGPAAKGALYSLKGKKLADVGGKDFGTYGSSGVQITATQWAFLEEGAAVIALQDVTTGKVDKTIDLLALWNPTADGSEGEAPRGGGNPGESALIRGGDGTLLVIAGSPAAGSIGVVDLASGDTTVIAALACEAADVPGAGGGGDGSGQGGGDQSGSGGAGGEELK